MMTVRVAIAVLWAASFAAGREISFSQPASPIDATSAEVTGSAPAMAGEVTRGSQREARDPENSADPTLDLFGNEIEEAVADYRIDLRGSVYERHSPDTAVAKLGSPST
jgi:hypothetical protein